VEHSPDQGNEANFKASDNDECCFMAIGYQVNFNWKFNKLELDDVLQIEYIFFLLSLHSLW
jgi:hypothetical protein